MTVGLRTGMLLDADRKNWSGNGPRPVRWTAWYPASDDAAEIIEETPEFVIGPVARDARLSDASPIYPVILLSHGTGGTAVGLSWLAIRLASEGYIVLGVDHHGNTASEPYHAAGFAAWWERARDLTVALDGLSDEIFLAGRIDDDDVTAIGFSLGGHTVMSLLGAITDFEIFKTWAHSVGARKGPREFPDLPDRMPGLMSDPTFLESWPRQAVSYKDGRVRRAILLAPAPPIRAFTSESLGAIVELVTILVGGSDTEAPSEICAEWLDAQLANSKLHNLGEDAGHAIFLCEGTELGREHSPEIYADNPGVDRAQIHDEAVYITLKALSDG